MQYAPAKSNPGANSSLWRCQRFFFTRRRNSSDERALCLLFIIFVCSPGVFIAGRSADEVINYLAAAGLASTRRRVIRYCCLLFYAVCFGLIFCHFSNSWTSLLLSMDNHETAGLILQKLFINFIFTHHISMRSRWVNYFVVPKNCQAHKTYNFTM